jgi:hypothetical protein
MHEETGEDVKCSHPVAPIAAGFGVSRPTICLHLASVRDTSGE